MCGAGCADPGGELQFKRIKLCKILKVSSHSLHFSFVVSFLPEIYLSIYLSFLAARKG